jgi:uncharacterized protein YbaA (DUF1428 family)
MARYVDGFLLAIPKKKLAAYRAIAKRAGKVWRDHGALEYRECVGEELKLPWGVSFIKVIKAKQSETVVFSWIVYKSKQDRNRVNAKVMKDPRIEKDMKEMPFDMKRMAVGGFEILVEA